MRRACYSLLAFMLLAAAMLAADDKKSSELRFNVVRESNGKPVRNASVILHPVNKDGKQSKGGLELKTDPDGKASLGGIPYGKLRVQVIAPRFQTYGEDIDISQPSHEITIKLHAPKDQYSIYKQ